MKFKVKKIIVPVAAIAAFTLVTSPGMSLPDPPTNVFLDPPFPVMEPPVATTEPPPPEQKTNNDDQESKNGNGFSFDSLLGGFNPTEILSQAQQKLEEQINQLIGPFKELLSIDPSQYFQDILAELNLENLDLSGITGSMDLPDPNKLMQELQSIGTGNFSFAEILGDSIPDNLLLMDDAAVELTGKLAKSQAEASAFSDEAQDKIKQKIEFGDETTTTAAELAAATQKVADQGKGLVQTGQATDVTQELERLQLEAMGLQLDAEATQSNQLSVLAAQQAAIFTETQQSRIDSAMQNQLLSDIAASLQGQKTGERMQADANTRTQAEGSQFRTFGEKSKK